MGLDVTHDAFHGAYSAFNRFRRFVLKSIGGSFPPHEDETLNREYWYWGEGYSSETHKGLLEFFGHSDCDGEISPEMCKVVAEELESILPNIIELVKTEESGGHIFRNGGYVEVTKDFIEGCRLAYERNEMLEFQ